MAKITREQIKKINDKVQNGFEFDLNYFLFHNEKTLVKNIDLSDKEVLEVRLIYMDNYEKVQQDNGISYRRGTGLKDPCIHISLYHKVEGSGMMSSHGLGQFIPIDTPQKKAMFSRLEKLTSIIDNEIIMLLHNKEKLNNPIILG